MAHRLALLGPVALLAIAAQGCCPGRGRPAPVKPIDTNCRGAASYSELDQKLRNLRKKMMSCIGSEARQGHVGTTHQCYRALRLVESARWWLKTLVMPQNRLPVYQPAEVFRLRFLCSIERLAAATTPKQVEARYLEMIRFYP